MTDRELLEFAAKAAGIEAHFEFGSANAMVLVKPRGFQVFWNPLADDADALRLLVSLKMDVCFGDNYVTVRGSAQMPIVNNAGDTAAATRRAIVRAAAAIGKEMP